MLRRRSLFLVALAALAQQAVVVAEPQPKAMAIYAPQPEYPSLPNGQRPEGSGMFVFHIDPKTGVVRSVSVEKSTGHAILDKAAIDALRRWRFTPGNPIVKIPMTFTTHRLPY